MLLQTQAFAQEEMVELNDTNMKAMIVAAKQQNGLDMTVDIPDETIRAQEQLVRDLNKVLSEEIEKAARGAEAYTKATFGSDSMYVKGIETGGWKASRNMRERLQSSTAKIVSERVGPPIASDVAVSREVIRLSANPMQASKQLADIMRKGGRILKGGAMGGILSVAATSAFVASEATAQVRSGDLQVADVKIAD